MQFTPEDIKRLYGTRLFLIPEGDAVERDTSTMEEGTQTVEEEPVEGTPTASPDRSLFTSGSAIDWKMKPNANLALVLTQEEFTRKELTALLKQAVLDAGVNIARIGFGIYDERATSWDFASMPVEVAVVCGGCAGQLTEELQVAGKSLFPVPPLAEASRHPDLQAQMKLVLRQANEKV